jgi:hypothetical protein
LLDRPVSLSVGQIGLTVDGPTEGGSRVAVGGCDSNVWPVDRSKNIDNRAERRELLVDKWRTQSWMAFACTSNNGKSLRGPDNLTNAVHARSAPTYAAVA